MSAPTDSRRAGRLIALFATITVVAVVVTAVLLVRGGGTQPTPVAEDEPVAQIVRLGEPIPVGTAPSDVEAGEGFVWTSDEGSGTVTRIDPATGATTTIAVGGEPIQLAVGDGAAWVRNGEDTITRVDAVSGAVSDPIPAGGTVSGMAVGGGFVWISHRDANTVTRIATSDNSLVGDAIAVGAGPRALAYGTDRLYVLNSDESTMSRIDPVAGAVEGRPVVLPEGVGGLEVEAGVVYVAAGGAVSPVPEGSDEAGAPILLDGWSYFEVDGTTMWVVYDEENVVRRLDVTAGDVVGEALPGLGTDVGRGLWAFESLWLTIPSENAVVRLATT